MGRRQRHEAGHDGHRLGRYVDVQSGVVSVQFE
jgi:hypothetical protein